MKLFVTRKGIVGMFLTFALATGLLGGTFVASAHSASTKASTAPRRTINPFCQRIGTSVGASSGAWTYCKGPQPSGSGHPTGTNSTFGSNVNAANVKEDITPNGTRAYGQSETSIASIGPYVVEAWNDATGFFAPCPSPKHKEELTGVGFSANSGTSFNDIGGLPNNCTTGFQYFGDPTVETWRPGGTAYFYVESLYLNLSTGQSDLALDACKATGTGSTANLSCSSPIIVATGGPTDFLDKEFLSIDPQRGRLYTSYTRFGASGTPTVNGQIELAVCDIGTASGGKGSGGGTAGAPVCFPGASPTPYLIVQPGQVCENEGAYPAVNLKTGDVYVAWEYNWATNFIGPAPCNTTVHTQNRVSFVTFSECLTLTPVSPCSPKNLNLAAVNIVSIDNAFIPGYNRNPSGSPANDFPRIAVSQPNGTVTIVWNDTRYHALGDILLQSFNEVSLAKVQSNPARINPDATGGLHFLPALRNSDDEGLLNVSYYQRPDGDVAHTNVDAVLNLNPRTTTGPGSVTLVTTSPSNWNNVSSDIIPNFGDYTDNYIHATSSAPYTDDVLYVAWSDGRLGVPQPFEAHGFS